MLESNWRYKNLETLSKSTSFNVDFDSAMVKRISVLKKKTLNMFTVEDLRLMIGQLEGLNYLIPLAIEVLTQNLFAEGDYYEGDLLQNVLKVNAAFWNENKVLMNAFYLLVADKKEELLEGGIDFTLFDEVCSTIYSK